MDVFDDPSAAAIAEVAETPEGIKMKLRDKQAALKLIGAQLGMFQTKVKLSW